MQEASLRQVLLVRACEVADPEGTVLALKLREEAARDAAAAHPEAAEAQLVARARRLLAPLLLAHPGLGALERGAWFVPGAFVLALLAFAAGLAVDRLGSERAVSLLAFPLIGLLVWNAGAAILWLWGRLHRRRALRALTALASSWASLRMRLSSGGFAMRVAACFAPLWLAECGALETARWRLRLHVGALAFAAGVAAGMYLAGFAFAYHVTWESTFLEAPQVRTLLALLLGPASLLLASPVPDVPAIEALRAPGSGPAAAWIHRFALTLLLAVGIPRGLLALRAALDVEARRAALRPAMEAPYYARVLAVGRGAGQRVRIVPYSTELSADASSRVLELAQQLFGNRALIEVMPGVAYGDEPPPVADGSVMVVFGLAQSPEQEVHGRFAAKAARAAAAHGGRTLVVLDPEGFLVVADTERVAERTRAWLRVLDEVGLRAAVLAADTGPDALLAEAAAALTADADAR